MADYVLDASAVLAYLQREPGAEVVAKILKPGACAISAVNFSEVAAKFAERGMPEVAIRDTLLSLILDVVPFDRGSALEAGALRPATINLGLSLGDRACVALGQRLQLPIMTTERSWSRLKLDVPVILARPG